MKILQIIPQNTLCFSWQLYLEGTDLLQKVASMRSLLVEYAQIGRAIVGYDNRKSRQNVSYMAKNRYA